MGIIFQASLLGLVLYSLLLVVVIPVLYSSSSNWDKGKNVILFGSIVWLGLVVAVAVLNFLK